MTRLRSVHRNNEYEGEDEKQRGYASTPLHYDEDDDNDGDDEDDDDDDKGK